jgi:hypothetical protein
MVLVLFADGTTAEVQECADVVRRGNAVIFLDYLGAPLVSFFTEDLLGYTLNPVVADEMAPETNSEPVGDQAGKPK